MTKPITHNVLVISDLHIPFEHPQALNFISHVQHDYCCDEIVSIGDMFDVYSLSKYIKTPDSYTATDEFKKSREKIQLWANEFPEMKCVLGNHEERINKRLTEGGIPKEFIKTFNEIWGLPSTWKWNYEFIINNIHYVHGNRDGMYNYVNIARDVRESVVCGHTHTSAGIHYMANYDKPIFAMGVGCLINQKTYAFNYSSEQTRRAVLSCGVVIGGKFPILIPMQ